MSWDSHHSTSERLAIEAEAARRVGNSQRAEKLYQQAAAEEAQAFSELPDNKQRTRGITAVSAVALSYKGRGYKLAEHLAYQYLVEELPSFAQAQLQGLLQMIWTAHGAASADIRFVPGDVLVSVKGGEILYGGAPLDLIIEKIASIKAVFFRTVEMLLERPFRKRGEAETEIQSMFRPWLFQAPAGSYQFAVRLEEPKQRALWDQPNKPRVDQVTTTFFRILRASASDPGGELPAVVPNEQYRKAFLKLSRNLAPSRRGKTFERLEVHDVSVPSEPVASFAMETRERLNTALQESEPVKGLPTEEPVILRGVLRALHLDKDWLEIAIADPPFHIRIDKAGDVLDDVIGPMVNRKVMVTVVQRKQKRLYRDIELDE